MPAPRQNGQPIVYSPRPDLVDAVRGELKALGHDSIQVPTKTDSCIEMLMMQPGTLLVLDWAHGATPVNQILGAVRGFFKIETRPIFLVIPEVDPAVVAIGIEYGVGQIHSGPISRVGIRTCLTELLTTDDSAQAVLDGLIQVASARRNDDWASTTPILLELNRQYPTNKRVIVELAENLIHSGSWQEAMALLTPLTSDPPHVRALHLLGRCYMQAKDFDGAIGLLSRAKLINPSNIERLIELGDALLASDQPTEAAGNYREALDLDQDSAVARNGLGTSLLMAGDINEALGLFNASSGPRELASIFNTAAILAMRFGRFDQGMQLYRSALKALGKEDTIASRLLFNMGLGYRRWGKHDKAKVCFDKGLALDPTFTKGAKYRDAPHGVGVDANRDLDDSELSLTGIIVPRTSPK